MSFLPLCVERNTKIIIGGPYNSGILARDLDGDVTFDYEIAPRSTSWNKHEDWTRYVEGTVSN